MKLNNNRKKLKLILSVFVGILMVNPSFFQNDEVAAEEAPKETVAETKESDGQLLKDSQLETTIQTLNGQALEDGLKSIGKAKATRISKEEALLADGWQKIEVVEEAIIPLKNGEELSFFFGGRRQIGQQIRVSDYNRELPNVEVIKADGERVEHLYDAWGNAFSSLNLVIGRDGAFGTPAKEWTDHGYYKKLLPDGMVSYKLIHSVAKNVDGSSFTFGNFQYETTMTGHLRGYVEVNQKILNNSGREFKDFLFGRYYDTQVAGNDKVTVSLIGGKRGLYIESSGYRLDYEFTIGNPPANWKGGEWSGASFTSSSYAKVAGFVSSEYGFSGFKEAGDEINPGIAGTAASKPDLDSAIYMKTIYPTFAVGQELSHDYVIKLNRLSKVTMTLDKTSDITNLGSPYEFSGKWNELDAETIDLYYQLDGGERVLFAKDLPNKKPLTDYPFKGTIPQELLTIGNHSLTVIGVNSEGVEDRASMTLNVLNTATGKYVDETGLSIRPDKVVAGATSTAYSLPRLNLLPDYEFLRVEGGTLTGNNVTGTHTTTPKVVTFVYKEIPKVVTGTVKYVLEDGVTPVKEIGTGNNVPSQVVPNLVIGSTYDPLLYKLDIPGYEYKGLENPEGTTVPNKNFEIVFKYRGVLALTSVPNEVSFDTQTLIVNGMKEIHPEEAVTVAIMDTRQSGVNWTLGMHLSEAFQNNAGEPFSGEVRFKDKNNRDMTITETKNVIQTREVNKLGEVSITWNNQNEGLYLKQLPGNTKGSYTGKLVWTLTDGL